MGLAFHEAFADIVALLQHFSFPEVVQSQIARTRGNLETENLLGALAQEFGKATGERRALRDAIGHDDENGVWQRQKPDPTALERIKDPHGRGAILVAAVFDAFLTIYNSRIADLKRIATGGRGVMPEGEIHPDLVNRLVNEAVKTARQVLNMCIRALDYCPPVDINFGDYLRALITADIDLVPDDPRVIGSRSWMLSGRAAFIRKACARSPRKACNGIARRTIRRKNLSCAPCSTRRSTSSASSSGSAHGSIRGNRRAR
jgi:hypothetical protein